MRKGTITYEMIGLAGHWWHMWRRRKGISRPMRYTYGPHPQQYLLAFTPQHTDFTQKPLAFFLHGGAWQFGRPEMFRAQAKFFLENGYAIILPSYRKLPRHNFLHIRADLNKLLAWSRDWMQEQGWQAPALLFSGMSAGGHLAAHLALDTAALSACELLPEQVKGLMICGAPVDLSQLSDNLILRRLAGPRQGNLFYQANPVHLLTPNTKVPILCLHGTHDGLVPLDSARSFISIAQRVAQSPVHFEIIPNGTHLDAGRWSYKSDACRKLVMTWLDDKVTR